MQTNCPPIDAALVRYLDEIFPDTAIDPNRSDAAAAYGSVLVVRHLKQQLQEQEEATYVSP